MKYLTDSKSVFSQSITVSPALVRVLGIGLFLALTALSAFVRIPLPFTPIPITMQTLFVLLSGLYLKKYDGSISQLAYIALGLIGLPIFASASGGLSVILGPTGGYLIGFLVAPFIVNLAYSKLTINNAYLKAIASMSLGLIAIHALGVLNLALFLKINILTAISLGSIPFLVGEGIKLIVGASLFTLHKK